MKLACPNCGHDEYQKIPQTNNLQCTKCGMQYAQKAWSSDNYGLLERSATRTVGEDCASNNPDPKHDPNIKRKTRDSNDEPGNDPIMRLKDNKKNKEDVGRRSMTNPFIKEAHEVYADFIMKLMKHYLQGVLDQNGFVKEFMKRVPKSKASDVYPIISDPYLRDAAQKELNAERGAVRGKKNNPFIREAREFRRSEWGEFMKNISEKNMVYNENPLPSQNKYKGKGKGNGNGKGGDDGDNLAPSYDYNQVERKEYRSSPKGRDVIPGYAEWEDQQIDKYYDGWVADHIENSGGKIIGSNTEKTMNLNDGERRHKPVYPTEAVYEHLLESRHMFNDDYAWVTASNGIKTNLSKSAFRHMRLADIFTYKELRKETYKWLEQNPKYVSAFLGDKTLPLDVKGVIQEIAVRAISKKAQSDSYLQSQFESMDEYEQQSWELAYSEHIGDILYELDPYKDLQKRIISIGGKLGLMVPSDLMSSENFDEWSSFFASLSLSEFFNLGILGVHESFDDMFEMYVNRDDEDPDDFRFEMNNVLTAGKESDDKKKLTQERLESERTHEDDDQKNLKKKKTHCASQTIISKAAAKAMIKSRMDYGIKDMEVAWDDFVQNGTISESALKTILAQTTDTESVIDENNPAEAPYIKKKSLSKNVKDSKTAQKQRLRTIPV